MTNIFDSVVNLLGKTPYESISLQFVDLLGEPPAAPYLFTFRESGLALLSGDAETFAFEAAIFYIGESSAIRNNMKMYVSDLAFGLLPSDNRRTVREKIGFWPVKTKKHFVALGVAHKDIYELPDVYLAASFEPNGELAEIIINLKAFGMKRL